MAPLLRRQATDAAFERLYQRHVKDVYRYAFAVLGERSDAEDVTQTTFLNAYRAFQRGERPQKPQNWLITIAHNVCRQRFRQSQRRPHEVEFDDAIGGALVEESDAPSVDDLRRAFGQLPPNQRAALVMRELEGRSYAEIAGVLEISVSALETLLFRARRSLREQLEEQLTCSEAAFAVSKQADGRLSQAEQRALRAHLRACPECASAASRQRAQRRALKTMLAVPLPQSLGSFFGGGAAVGTASTVAAAAGGTGVVLKAAAVLTAGVVVGGGAYVGVEQKAILHHRQAPVAAKVMALPATAAVVPGRAARPGGLPMLSAGTTFGEHNPAARPARAARATPAGPAVPPGKAAAKHAGREEGQARRNETPAATQKQEHAVQKQTHAARKQTRAARKQARAAQQQAKRVEKPATQQVRKPHTNVQTKAHPPAEKNVGKPAAAPSREPAQPKRAQGAAAQQQAARKSASTHGKGNGTNRPATKRHVEAAASSSAKGSDRRVGHGRGEPAELSAGDVLVP